MYTYVTTITFISCWLVIVFRLFATICLLSESVHTALDCLLPDPYPLPTSEFAQVINKWCSTRRSASRRVRLFSPFLPSTPRACYVRTYVHGHRFSYYMSRPLADSVAFGENGRGMLSTRGDSRGVSRGGKFIDLFAPLIFVVVVMVKLSFCGGGMWDD